MLQLRRGPVRYTWWQSGANKPPRGLVFVQEATPGSRVSQIHHGGSPELTKTIGAGYLLQEASPGEGQSGTHGGSLELTKGIGAWYLCRRLHQQRVSQVHMVAVRG